MLEPTNACEPNVVRLERRCGSAKRWKGAVEPGAPWEGGLGSNVTTGLGELTYSRKECSPRKEAP